MELLVTALEHDPLNRSSARDGLKMIGAEAVASVVGLLERSSDETVRKMAASILATSNDSRAEAALRTYEKSVVNRIIALAVVAQQQGKELIFTAEDGDGSTVSLTAVTRPAILIMAEALVPRFQEQPKIWKRVINEGAIFDAVAATQGGLERMMLASVELNRQVRASEIKQGAFFLCVVDSYRSARILRAFAA